MIFSCGVLASNVQTLDLPWFHVNHWLNLVFFFLPLERHSTEGFSTHSACSFSVSLVQSALSTGVKQHQHLTYTRTHRVQY